MEEPSQVQQALCPNVSFVVGCGLLADPFPHLVSFTIGYKMVYTILDTRCGYKMVYFTKMLYFAILDTRRVCLGRKWTCLNVKLLAEPNMNLTAKWPCFLLLLCCFWHMCLVYHATNNLKLNLNLNAGQILPQLHEIWKFTEVPCKARRGWCLEARRTLPSQGKEVGKRAGPGRNSNSSTNPSHTIKQGSLKV